ncbi:MAG: hypothetical protein ACOC1K_01375 [Nanoarchaeota archaeon]
MFEFQRAKDPKVTLGLHNYKQIIEIFVREISQEYSNIEYQKLNNGSIVIIEDLSNTYTKYFITFPEGLHPDINISIYKATNISNIEKSGIKRLEGSYSEEDVDEVIEYLKQKLK